MFSKINAFWIFRTNRAFTLAEVLITLGIIGIVAAMALPALIAKYDKKVALCKHHSRNCTRLLLMDNWEFKDDYPW